MKPVIMVSHFFPFPPRSGAEIRASMVLRALSGMTRVALVSSDDGSGDASAAMKFAEKVLMVPTLGFGRMKSAGRRLIEPFTSFPAAGRWLDIKAFGKAIRSLGKNYDGAVIWLEASWLLRTIQPGDRRPVVLDQHNLDSEVLKARAANAGFPLSLLYRHDFRKQRAYEKRELPRASFILAVSREDRDLHEKLFGLKNVEVLPNLLDLSKYPCSGARPEEKTVIMTGDFNYGPNREGARWLTGRVLPLVRRRMSGVRAVFAGKSSDGLPFGGAGVELHGPFKDPADVFPLASVAAAPIFTGGGSRYKILEALACGVPVVSTSPGAEGLELADGEGVLIRDGEAQFADAVVSVLSDETLAAELSRKGRKKVEELYSMERASSFIRTALETLEHSKR